MNIAEILIGVAGLVGGAKALKKGLGDAEEEKRERDKIVRVMSHQPFRTEVSEVRNIQQRIQRIVPLIRKGRDNPMVRAFAVRAVSKKCGSQWCVAEKDYLGEVQAVYKAVRSNVRYVRDTWGKDLFQHPMRTFEFGGGDCDDFSIVIGACLQAIGYPVRLRVIRTRGAPDWNHIYNMVAIPPRSPRKWIPVDASVNFGVPWQAPKHMIADYRDFQIP